jgi:hypothetical protein
VRIHRGSAIAATWLIGIGSVFLVREALGLAWEDAWPLFLILVGAAGLISRLIGGPRGVAALWSYTWPVLWIAVGVVLLLSTTGNLATAPADLAANAWPWILVVLGIWFLVGALAPLGRGPIEELAIPLGGVREAAVRIRFGAGELDVHRASAGHLVDGHFEGGVVRSDHGPGRVDLAQDTTFGVPWLDTRSDWTVGLATEVPLDLRFDTGAAKASLDLSELQVRSLDLHTGASQTRIRLPRAAGATSVRAETGAAELIVEVPTGVAARIRSRMAIGSSRVDEVLFPRTATGFESAGFGTATNRVDLDLRGGVGSIQVVGVA